MQGTKDPALDEQNNRTHMVDQDGWDKAFMMMSMIWIIIDNCYISFFTIY